jgi:3-oxoadipate enol-lactonase
VQVGEVGLFYQRLGPSGSPPVVLIMGWGGDHTAWAFQLPAFAAAFDVIALDNRGVGQSDVPDRPFSIADMAADVAGLMDELGVGAFHVCGASMGGMIAQELALGYPQRVRTLQLHCTTAGIDSYGRLVMDNFLQVKARGDAEEFVRFSLPWLLTRKTFAENPEFIEAWIQRALDYPFKTSHVGLSRQGEAIGGHDTRGRLPGLRVPTLITTGTEDILVPPTASQELHALIPGSELAQIPAAGHLHFIEQAAAFNEVALDFLRKHAA